MLRLRVVTLVVFLAVGCGGKLASENAGADNAPPDVPAVITKPASVDVDCANIAFAVSTSMCIAPSRCFIEGALPDGRVVSERCTGEASTTCELFVDGARACVCPTSQLDFSNTCPNGVPACSAWSYPVPDTWTACR